MMIQRPEMVDTIVKVASLYAIVGKVTGITFKYLIKVILVPWIGFNVKSVVAILVVSRLDIIETILMTKPVTSDT